MKYTAKIKLKNWCDKYVTADNIKIVILFIPLTIALIRNIENVGFSFYNFLDISILISFLAVFLCDTLATIISNIISRKTEDANKLTQDYKNLIKKYCRSNLYSFTNTDNSKVIFPCEVLYLRRLYQDELYIDIDHSNSSHRYTLPNQVSEYSSSLMKAHSNSIIYNNQNVRIDSIQKKADHRIVVKYSKTTYFDSLITNRAMDYVIFDGKSLREIYEPGPFFSSLEESKFSNHLGYNGLVELSDGNFIFVKRNSNVSTAKNMWSLSISASYKAIYGLDDQQHLTTEYISNAINKEISDELKIQISDEHKTLYKSIIGFYRDYVEGGKPHFVFYYKTPNYNKDQFLNNFNYAIRGRAKKRNVVIDGDKFVFFTKEQLLSAHIEIDGIVIGQKKYTMNPSITTSLAMILESIEDKYD